MNVNKAKEVLRARYSKGWTTLSEACTRTTMWRLNEVEGLVGMIRGPANPKSGGARRKVRS